MSALRRRAAHSSLRSELSALPALTRNIEEIFRGAGNSGEKGACAGLQGRAERVAE